MVRKKAVDPKVRSTFTIKKSVVDSFRARVEDNGNTASGIVENLVTNYLVNEITAEENVFYHIAPFLSAQTGIRKNGVKPNAEGVIYVTNKQDHIETIVGNQLFIIDYSVWEIKASDIILAGAHVERQFVGESTTNSHRIIYTKNPIKAKYLFTRTLPPYPLPSKGRTKEISEAAHQLDSLKAGTMWSLDNGRMVFDKSVTEEMKDTMGRFVAGELLTKP